MILLIYWGIWLEVNNFNKDLYNQKNLSFEKSLITSKHHNRLQLWVVIPAQSSTITLTLCVLEAYLRSLLGYVIPCWCDQCSNHRWSKVEGIWERMDADNISTTLEETSTSSKSKIKRLNPRNKWVQVRKSHFANSICFKE